MTPAHFDSYHNLLFQVHGTKEFTIGAFSDHPDLAYEAAERESDPAS